ncbi:hypothetical protein FGO68_gene5189 [Halteria grandinella]|uniref:Uncharacterized protein n=1 Tax=Halteria grandinella TaxID=5974 RepID=A0A8J8T0P3_HALGN|nr:hypothetical protein FGO68_gene5189 [Halteria grandinella]
MGGVMSECCSKEVKLPLKYEQLTPEESHILKKQQDLKLFTIPCSDLERAFLTYLHFDSISEGEFSETLELLNLLQKGKGRESNQWMSFYGKMKVQQYNGRGNGKGQMALMDVKAIMVGLYFLTSQKSTVKAKFMANLFFDYGRQGFMSSDNEKGDVGGLASSDQLEATFKPGSAIAREISSKERYLRRDEELRKLFIITINLSLNLLPYYALADYPSPDRSLFHRFLCHWNPLRDYMLDLMLDNFCRGDLKLSVDEFIVRANAFPQYFDPLGIREEAKREFTLLERRAEEGDNSGNGVNMWAIDIPEKYRQNCLYFVHEETKAIQISIVKQKSNSGEGRKKGASKAKKQYKEDESRTTEQSAAVERESEML